MFVVFEVQVGEQVVVDFGVQCFDLFVEYFGDVGDCSDVGDCEFGVVDGCSC